MDTSIDQQVGFAVGGETYYLTVLRESDIPAMQAILSNTSVSDRLIKVPKPYTLELAKEWITAHLDSNASLLSIPTVEARTAALFNQPNAIPLQAIRTSTGLFIGAASLTPYAGSIDQRVELGYYLDPAYQRKGIMLEAAKTAIWWAKDKFGVERLCGSADCVNYGSEKVLEKVVRETAKGAVVQGETWYEWPVEKVVEGREVRSLSRIWQWDI